MLSVQLRMEYLGTQWGWVDKRGMHHLDAHLLEDGQWIACVDGWTAVPSLII